MLKNAPTKNPTVLAWLEDKLKLVNPDKIVWIDGSEEQIEALRAEACSTGEMIKLNQELLPDCYLHRTAVNDVARVEARTFICAPTKEEAGPTNNWMDPDEAYKMLYDIAKDSYKGRTAYIIPYSMGPVGSKFSKAGIELTDSIYVVLNMCIMTRVGFNVLDVLYISLLTIGLAGNLDLQRLNVIEQAVRRLLDRLPLPVPGLHLVRIDPIILLQFVHDQVIAARRGRDGILQATLHQPKAIQHLRRDVQSGHCDEHQIHQVDHLLTGRVGII